MRNKVVYAGWTFTDSDAANGSLAKSQDLTSASLSADSISVEVRCPDPAITQFTLNAPMTYFYRERQKGTYYLQSVTRVSPNHYALSGLSALGLLASMPHLGGLYTGQTVQEIVEEICGSVPVLVKTCLADIRLYGWLPAANPPQKSARDNLSQVLFAVGAYLGTDLDGVLRVEPLWDGVACAITADQIYQDTNVQYDAPVSAVTVTEHQYIQGSEEQELFNGTAQDGALITFDEPHHSYEASGVQILSSGANWVRLSAGTGVVTGKSYLHLTRQITETVTAGAAENVKSENDATLVSLVNSRAVAQRLAAYYRCQETIQAPFVADPEKPGYVVSIYHPYEHRMVTACIADMDITMSAVLRSDSPALVGFLPPQPDSAEYLDERVVLTGSGEFEFPPDAENAVAVLVSAGQGGGCGQKGEDGTAPSVSFTTEIGANYSGYGYGPAAKGGPGGLPGSGGKFLRIELDLTAGRKFAYSCGVGGDGAPYDPDGADVPGQLGGDTTFGSFTSATGETSEQGYADPITGEVFAAKGLDGIAGGDSAGAPDADPSTTAWEYPTEAPPVIDEDGVSWPGGSSNIAADGKLKAAFDSIGDSSAATYAYASASGALGSGAAAGNPGTPGTAMGTISVDKTTSGDQITLFARSYGAKGRPGSDALLTPKKPARYGQGGRGGYGGGAGSPPGYALTGQRGSASGVSVDRRATPGDVGIGGAGSPGGPAADGCIIAYYRKPKPAARLAPLVTKDQKWFLDRLGRRFIV